MDLGSILTSSARGSCRRLAIDTALRSVRSSSGSSAAASLLAEYIEGKYLPLIKSYMRRASTQYYYVHMAVAWLVAEILIKQYDEGVNLLKEKILPLKTHNKAIQKAIESYRITKEQKEYLRSLKMNTK